MAHSSTLFWKFLKLIYMSKIILLAQALFGILFVAFSVFNFVRGCVQGEFFPIAMFFILTILSLGWTVASIKDIRHGE